MEEPQYHVLLQGRTVGPYDRRTIVGMRIKQTLTGEDVVISTEGKRSTVADLIRTPRTFHPDRSGSFSLVNATFTACLVDAERGRHKIPRFRGELEARMQVDVIRLAGRFRQGFGWREGRVKIPLADVVHARLRSSLLDLWLRGDGDKLQRVTLELFSPQSAAECAGWLGDATPFPEPSPSQVGPRMPMGLVVAVAGVVLTVGIVLAVFLMRR